MEKWTREANYMGTDYSDYYILLSQSRDSEPLTISNFNVALEMLGGETETILVVRFNHWLVGWVEAIMIHESDSAAIDKAEEIEKMIEDYPVLDEDDFEQTKQDMGWTEEDD
ncbi:MAG: hypothetical protein M0R06_00875 [Sphaerochaeta sp.]|jgi:hypothetical protein|nr:hypothetical protein [Sphaerochaeta sp.]